MAGHQGVELSGPSADADAVRAALLAAGERHGLLRGGTRAYFSSVIESGWIGYPLPGIYTGRGAARLPRVAQRDRLAGAHPARRQLPRRRHRGLLRQPVRARLRPAREVRPRLHRRRGPAGAPARDRGARRSPSSGTAPTSRGCGPRSWAPARATRRSSSRSAPTPSRSTTRCGPRRAPGRDLHPLRLQQQRGRVPVPRPHRRRARRTRHRADPDLGRARRRLAQAARGAARADDDPGHGRPRALRRRRTAAPASDQSANAREAPRRRGSRAWHFA